MTQRLDVAPGVPTQCLFYFLTDPQDLLGGEDQIWDRATALTRRLVEQDPGMGAVPL